jgi:hypothetical protein
MVPMRRLAWVALASTVWVGCGGNSGHDDGSLRDSSVEQGSRSDAASRDAISRAGTGGAGGVPSKAGAGGTVDGGSPSGGGGGHGIAGAGGLAAGGAGGSSSGGGAGGDQGAAGAGGLAVGGAGMGGRADAADAGVSDVGGAGGGESTGVAGSAVDGSAADGAGPDTGPSCVGQPVSHAPTTGLACDGDDWCWVRPSPQGNNLRAVWADAPDDVWAVGDRGTTLHFDGATWHVMSPPAGAAGGAVWASGPTNAWVVFESSAEDPRTIVDRWDGQQWTEWITPGGGLLFRASIWGTGPDDVWLVATDSKTVPFVWAFIHWDGSQWTRQSIPGQPYPLAISGVSSDDIWATAGPATFHYDGSTWTQVPSPSGAVSFTSPGPPPLFAFDSGDVWTGDYSFFHWDGQSWDVGRPGASTDPLLQSVWGAAPDDVWFLTDTFLHLDATGNFTSFDPGTSATLYSMSGTGSSDVWAVGAGGAIVHFDGNTWSSLVTDPLQTAGYVMTGISGTSDGQVWVVGKTESNPAQGLVIGHDDAGWSALPAVPLSGSTAPSLAAIWATAADDIWVAGTTGQMFHWDGALWEAGELGTTANISALWSDGPDDLWAVGGDTIAHSDGQQWTLTTGASLGELGVDLGAATSVWGFSSSDVWVTGTGGAVLHWDGQTWTESSKVAGGKAIWGTSATDIWAGGSSLSHYDGASWTQLNPPISSYPPISYIDFIRGRGPDDVFFSNGGGIWHWDGCSLALQSVPPTGQIGMNIWVGPAGPAWITNGSSLFVQSQQ